MLVECKPLRSPESDDLVKLGNCLKDCIDRIARNNGDLTNTTICGIVYEGITDKLTMYLSLSTYIILMHKIGYHCRALAMDLRYHGIYPLMELGSFYLPQSSSNFDVMLGTFQVMNTIQVGCRCCALQTICRF